MAASKAAGLLEKPGMGDVNGKSAGNDSLSLV